MLRSLLTVVRSNPLLPLSMPDSWTKTYEEEGTLFPAPPHEGEAMLQLSSSLSSLDPPSPLPVLARPSKQYLLGPLTHEASSSSPLDSLTPTPDLPFPSSSHPRSQRTTISSVKSFASSPLNPTSPTGTTAPSSFPSSPFNRSGSRASTHINRIASEESRALASHQSSTRGSMILYHITTSDALQPPVPSHLHRNSVLSISGDSIVSLSSDSKYPARTIGSERGLIAYAYDPSLDELGSASPAEDDYLHDPDEKSPRKSQLLPVISLRGVINVLALLALIFALLCLFVVYPVIRFYHDNSRNVLITFNTRVNRSGQVPVDPLDRRSQMFFV
jgi:Beta-glucan synthesis-associated protein SKN1/KRE6/Sbg1